MKSRYWQLSDAQTEVLSAQKALWDMEEKLHKAKESAGSCPMAGVFLIWKSDLRHRGADTSKLADHPKVVAVRVYEDLVAKANKRLVAAQAELDRVRALPPEAPRPVEFLVSAEYDMPPPDLDAI